MSQYVAKRFQTAGLDPSNCKDPRTRDERTEEQTLVCKIISLYVDELIANRKGGRSKLESLDMANIVKRHANSNANDQLLSRVQLAEEILCKLFKATTFIQVIVLLSIWQKNEVCEK